MWLTIPAEKAKTGRARLCYLIAEIAPMIAALLPERGAILRGERMDKLRAAFSGVLIRAGIEGPEYTLYGLKHSAAIELYRAAGNLLEVRDFCGHSKAEQTEVYLRRLGVLDEEKRRANLPKG